MAIRQEAPVEAELRKAIGQMVAKLIIEEYNKKSLDPVTELALLRHTAR